MMDSPSDDKSLIAFFDVETTVPGRPGQGFAILEFGAILVCPRKLEEIDNYSTLVRPADPSLISSLSVRCNGITHDAVTSAPTFAEVADKVYDILHERIWAGHNIVRFDCARIREAFNEIGRPAPESKGTIDSLVLLTQRFGRRAGDMKMASLATYFGLGKQKHRSLDDVRMNLEVIKHCATVLFLESSLPNAFPEKSWVSPNATTRSRKNGKSPSEGIGPNTNTPSSSSINEIMTVSSPSDQQNEGNHPIFSLLTSTTAEETPNLLASNTAPPDSFDMGALSNEMNTESLLQDVSMEEKPVPEFSEKSSTIPIPNGCSGSVRFLKPEEVSVSSIHGSLFPVFRGGQRMKLFHGDDVLQLYCPHLRLRFGLSSKYVDQAGRPRLSFVVDATPNLCDLLDACDSIARKSFVDSGSSSDWRKVVIRKDPYVRYPTVRLHIPTITNGDIAQYATEMYKEDPSGTTQKLEFSKLDVEELDTFFQPGIFVDAYISMDSYDYQQTAGIRLVAKKLIIHID